MVSSDGEMDVNMKVNGFVANNMVLVSTGMSRVKRRKVNGWKARGLDGPLRIDNKYIFNSY